MCIFQTYVLLDTEVDEKSQGSSYSSLLTTAESVELLASLSPVMLAQHPEENKSSPLPWVPDQSDLEAGIPAWIPAAGVRLTELSGSLPGNMKDLVCEPSLFWLMIWKINFLLPHFNSTHPFFLPLIFFHPFLWFLLLYHFCSFTYYISYEWKKCSKTKPLFSFFWHPWGRVYFPSHGLFISVAENTLFQI